MSYWKRAVIYPFLKTPSNSVRFVRYVDEAYLRQLPKDTRLVFWGEQHADIREVARHNSIPVIRIEDGFIRSIGLGSDLHYPLSLAVDEKGIYYDPYSGSRLEQILTEIHLSVEDRRRAAKLRENIVKQRVSKYNIGEPFSLDKASSGKRVILVPGQVEDDASLLRGSPTIRTNLDLLKAVRAMHPDAWIVYKPHPDVVSGNRRGEIPQEALAPLADQVAGKANIAECFDLVDEVHTMTSLAGFEALLFGKVVHCYGGPFYSGWVLRLITCGSLIAPEIWTWMS